MIDKYLEKIQNAIKTRFTKYILRYCLQKLLLMVLNRQKRIGGIGSIGIGLKSGIGTSLLKTTCWVAVFAVSIH